MPLISIDLRHIEADRTIQFLPAEIKCGCLPQFFLLCYRHIFTRQTKLQIRPRFYFDKAQHLPFLCNQIDFTETAMKTVGQQPVSFFSQIGSDLRLTFDRNLEALPPNETALFDPDFRGVPVTDGVIMEIKYGKYLPAFLRKLTRVNAPQLSLSKYALCRAQIGGISL